MYRVFKFLMMCIALTAVTGTAVAAEEYSRNVESFDFLVDGSANVSDKNGNALSDVLHKINARIPEIGYPQSGIHTFAPESEVLDFRPYERARFSDGIDGLIENFPKGKNTSLGKGLDHYGAAYSDMLRKGAVIVFTDGHYKSGRDSLNEVKIFYLTQPEMCLHFVSLAKNEKSQALIDEMAAVSSCSVSVLAADLVNNDDAAEDFVRKVFYSGSESAAQEASSAPVIDFVMLSIPFGFDSDKLDANTIKVADALSERLKEQGQYNLKIDGYTCNVGPESYNLGLSKRRAEAVKNYIVNTGIEPSRISTEGHGVSNPRYDNATREGRSLNRRVEFTFFLPEETM